MFVCCIVVWNELKIFVCLSWNNLRDFVDQKREEINIFYGFQNFYIECNEIIVSCVDLDFVNQLQDNMWQDDLFYVYVDRVGFMRKLKLLSLLMNLVMIWLVL